MSSLNYQVNWDAVGSGGDDISSSTNYEVRDTIGQQGTGFSNSSIYGLSAGYRTADQDLASLSFSIGTQENGTQTSYTSFSTTTNQVVVTDAASFSPNDFIGVVENEGLNQQVAVGFIKSIAGTTITVDHWDGSTSTMSQIPSGGDDFVYRLDGSSAILGTLTDTTAKTSITATNVTSNAANGYTVFVSDDGNLRTPGAFIHNVSDGAVTIGSEEYGWQVFGDTAVNTGLDNPFSTSTTPIQQSSSVTSDAERVPLIYKISISPTTSAGDYTHMVYFTVTANY